MPGRQEELIQHQRVRRCLVGDDLRGVTLVESIARSKNRRAALASRRGDVYTSMTCPN
jgi:hypothetical protein